MLTAFVGDTWPLWTADVSKLKLIVAESRSRPARNTALTAASSGGFEVVNFPARRCTGLNRHDCCACADGQQYGRRGQFGFAGA